MLIFIDDSGDPGFKFHKSSATTKKQFLQTVSKYSFQIRSIVVDKENIRSTYLKQNKESFFNYIVMQLLKNNRNNLRVYLSRQLDNKSNHLFTDLKFVDSKTNVLIQLADMVAGAIAWQLNRKDNQYMKILQKKGRVDDIWNFK